MRRDPARDSDRLDDRTRRVLRGLTELAALSRQDASDVLLRLLRPLARSGQSLAAVLGYSADDLYELYRKAFSLYRDERYESALAICEAIQALDSNYLSVDLLMAFCHAKLDDYEQALACLSWAERSEQWAETVDQRQSVWEAYLWRGYFLYRMARLEDAVQTLQELLRLDPGLSSEEAQQGRELLLGIRELLGQ